MIHMRIPELREQLRRLADEIEPVAPAAAERLRFLADSAYRRPAIRRAPRKNRTPDEKQRAEVVKLFREHPDWHQQDIATAVGTNSGRVSDIVHPREKEAA